MTDGNRYRSLDLKDMQIAELESALSIEKMSRNRIAELEAQVEALKIEIAGFTEDVKLPDIEAIGKCRLRVRRIARLNLPLETDN